MRLRLIPREKAFFEHFNSAAENMVDGARLLQRMVDDFSDPKSSHKAVVDAEHKGDAVTYEIMNALNVTFVTPLDREDIHALASGLDDVMDFVEAAADLLVLHHIETPTEAVRIQAEILVRACETVAASVERLGSFKGMKPLLAKVHEIEKEGDRIFRQTVADLFDGRHKAMDVLRWKEIHEQVEFAIDQCEKIADTLEAIVLKHT